MGTDSFHLVNDIGNFDQRFLSQFGKSRNTENVFDDELNVCFVFKESLFTFSEILYTRLGVQVPIAS